MYDDTPTVRLGITEPPAPQQAPKRRRRGLRYTVTIVLVLLVLGGVAAGQLSRTPPAATVAYQVPTQVTIPGTAPTLPWPSAGQSAVDVLGLGSFDDARPDTSVPIGSVAKVMTAYQVLLDHPLDVGQSGPSMTVTASDVADYQSRIPSGQSLVQVVAGEQLTERQALQALMLPSANNIAALLAKWDGGSITAFVAKMNATAAQLGMTGTQYTDPSGFAPQTVSTAADQIHLAEKALEQPAFAEIVAQASATLPVVGKVKNYNALLGVDGVFGVKTGSTDEAGGNLVFAAHLTVGDRTLTVVGAVFNQPGADTPHQLAAVNTVTRRLLAALRQAVQVYTVLPAGSTAGQLSTAWQAGAELRTADAVKLIGWPGLKVTVTLDRVTPGHAVRATDPLGTVTAKLGDQTATTQLHADHDITAPSTWWRLRRIH